MVTTRDCLAAVALALLLVTTTQCDKEESREDPHESHEVEIGHEEAGEHGHDEASMFVTMSDEALTANGVVIERASPGLVRSEIDLPAEIVLNADRVAHIVPRFAGVVLEVKKVLGDRVSAGDVLAVIQSNVSGAPYEVTSMLAGSIIEKHVTLGEYVRDDADIFVVADLSTVWVNISVYARFLTDVRPSQKVRIASPGLSESAEGVIDYVGPMVGESTRTGIARMVLSNPGHTWQPGLFVTAHIAVSEARAAVAVPDEAIQTIRGAAVVFVRQSEGFAVRPITIGRRGGDLVEVADGLAPGEEYVARGSFIFKAEIGKSEAGHDH
jgi:cobalt-zinc-cadmium efflux system membrane fusion protein